MARLSFLALAACAAAQSWQPLDCPGNDQDGKPCQTPAAAYDRAVSLFFQKDENFNGAGGFAVVAGAGATMCARNWTEAESGAVGSCYFLLPAQTGYSVQTWGASILMLSSEEATLSAGSLSPGIKPLGACPSGTLTAGTPSASCTSATSTADAWVSLYWQAHGNASFACSAGGSPVCAYTASSTGDGGASSCNGMWPAATALTCTATAGAVTFASAVAVQLAVPYSTGGGTSLPVCPPASPTPNDCDCTGTNAPASGGGGGAVSDALVTLVSSSVDDGFNSFHCYVGSSNVCGWGTATGMTGSRGSCTFLLPAGASYTCAMEWGAAAFPNTSMTRLGRTIFPSQQQQQTAAGYTRGDVPGAQYIAPPHELPRLRRLFAAWREEHGVSYADEGSEASAFRTFTGHVATATHVIQRGHIVGHPHLDAVGRPTRFNRYADTPRRQWERTHRGKARAGQGAAHASAVTAAAAVVPPPAPATADWRAKGVVTPVKDQGQCGSCWSFSTTGAVESAWAIAGNALPNLSEQQLVSCAGNVSGLDGCDGGFPFLAMSWLAAVGPDTEASYPYASSNGGAAPACQDGVNGSVVKAGVAVTGYHTVPPALPGTPSPLPGLLPMESALLAWTAAYGPLSVLVDAMTQIWWTYTGGVVTGCCDSDIDHAVLLVGYNASSSSLASSVPPYYTIKNSWGKDWGEEGYVRLAIGSNQCGINVTGNAVLPTVSGGAVQPAGLWECPPDARAINTSTTASCLWYNNSGGMVLPPSDALQPYCEYFSSGYMGYSYAGSLDQGSYPCAPSFTSGGDGGSAWFCTLTAGQHGFPGFPVGAVANCSELNSQGVIGYSWPR